MNHGAPASECLCVEYSVTIIAAYFCLALSSTHNPGLFEACNAVFGRQYFLFSPLVKQTSTAEMTLHSTPSRHDMLCFAAHAKAAEESQGCAAEGRAEQEYIAYAKLALQGRYTSPPELHSKGEPTKRSTDHAASHLSLVKTMLFLAPYGKPFYNI